ncbi:hypothetical protein HYDPIDRAFT_34807 [Hydnomerulius pinastri MD-312]|uniref:CxC1-like cysteine cluster associated with KDZ transposases domain-containing protein n=1 Tax=Hydnomerulius pinastri MD-312 TaxID=994086 RepID=A0A0C9W5E6_9AGAM|nr:hypothetical protein HYDPIDRAFT_34807 [Hydnomerulius pinastri MD-312]
MTPGERRALEDLQNRAKDEEGQWEDVGGSELDNVLDGSERLEISNGGNELGDLIQEMFGDFSDFKERNPHPRRDTRTRRDHVLCRTEAFNLQMHALIGSYLQWSHDRDQTNGSSFFTESVDQMDVNSGIWKLNVVDVFRLGAGKVNLAIKSNDAYITSALVRQGLIPCLPISPSTAITIGALEFYRTAHLRSPHFSIQAFVKTLCDLHGVTFHRVLSRQFSIAFDVYLQICSEVDKLVSQVLHRDSADWRLKHVCPACTYTLNSEAPLKFKLLYAMDGNDSLKRIIRRSPEIGGDDTAARPSCELPTYQVVSSGLYLPRDYVNQFGKDVPTEDTSTDNEKKDENPCAGRWKNMDDQKTKKTWGVYDETGIFLAVCRHGMSLLIADMVQSGELAKYPLAVVNKLINTFGSDLGGSYDIGCQFSTTLANSSIGPLAQSSRHSCLVGAFHGHAHRRLCQLSHLTLYTEGLGLKDLETCEHTFSKSNALASTVRHSSIFHRQQSINSYFEHNDDYEVYANLSNFIYSNYKQALDILADGEANLPDLMRDLNFANKSVFNAWREDEKAYLQSLSQEPQVKTLQMEYWQRLVKLSASKRSLDTILATWDQSFQDGGATAYSNNASRTRRAETALRHAQESYDKDLCNVQTLENKLDLPRRWAPEDDEWQHAGRLVAKREYQRALDWLESLVVARIFELSKMNRAGTGYKMRKHIAKALQTRSAAIRMALDRYNTAAQAMRPPRRTLQWDEVVEYAFLADFDLLRDTRQDVSQRPWATPAARYAMDLHFKMVRAEEEIQCLNTELQRLLTYIIDEERYLLRCEELLKPQHPALARQVALRRGVRGRCNMAHIQRLHNLSKLPGFTGTFAVGMSAWTGPGESGGTPCVVIPPSLASHGSPLSTQPLTQLLEDQDSTEDLEEEEDAKREAQEASLAVEEVIEIATDISTSPTFA